MFFHFVTSPFGLEYSIKLGCEIPVWALRGREQQDAKVKPEIVQSHHGGNVHQGDQPPIASGDAPPKYLMYIFVN
jgi:hypothetical protein